MKSKTYNSKLNVIIGLICQLITTILTFITKTIFIKLLGENYLGINSLFANILSVLSLVELGFGNALLFGLYKPLADNDRKKISALINFYKKVYNIIFIIVLLLGFSMIPILKYIINLPVEMDNIYLYYILFVINTAASYIWIYKSSLINADQKSYIIKIYSLLMNILQLLLQILILILTHNYFLYLIIMICCTIINNCIISFRANKMYPYIKSNEKLQKKDIKDIIKNVKSMFIYKISAVIVNNTDNILISLLVGTIYVGFYSNYYMIINMLLLFINVIYSSLYSSIGNLNAENDNDKKVNVFFALNSLTYILIGTCTICIYFLCHDFIYIWIGEKYLLSQLILIAIVINFYTQGILNPVWVFRDTTGLFNDVRLCSVLTCVLNLGLSIVLGKFYGIFGIIIATSISRLLTNFWYHPYKLFKNIFKIPSKKYFLKQVYQIFVIIVLIVMINFINQRLSYELNIYIFAVKAIIIFILSLLFIVLSQIKTNEFKYLLKIIKRRK